MQALKRFDILVADFKSTTLIVLKNTVANFINHSCSYMNKGYIIHYSCLMLFALIFVGCQERIVEMPKELYGKWNSKQHRSDITLGKDSVGTFAIVYHRTYDGQICPVRYTVQFKSSDIGVIQAEGCITFYYDINKKSLFLSPGGDYEKE